MHYLSHYDEEDMGLNWKSLQVTDVDETFQ